jgi:hypothetical protein
MAALKPTFATAVPTIWNALRSSPPPSPTARTTPAARIPGLAARRFRRPGPVRPSRRPAPFIAFTDTRRVACRRLPAHASGHLDLTGT